MPHISHIAALTRDRAIGKENDLLLIIPDDLKRFKELTTGHTVLMGRKTWESLPEHVRPLPNRRNIVLTRDAGYDAPGAIVVTSLEEALARAGDGEVFVIGGGRLFAETLPRTDRLYLTLIDSDESGDIFYPPYEELFTKSVFEEAREYNGIPYRWITLEREHPLSATEAAS